MGRLRVHIITATPQLHDTGFIAHLAIPTSVVRESSNYYLKSGGDLQRIALPAAEIDAFARAGDFRRRADAYKHAGTHHRTQAHPQGARQPWRPVSFNKTPESVAGSGVEGKIGLYPMTAGISA